MKLSPIMKGILVVLALILVIRLFTESPEQAMYRQVEEQNQMMQQQQMQMLNDLNGQNQMMQQQMNQELQMYNGMNQQQAYPNPNNFYNGNSNGYRTSGQRNLQQRSDENDD